MSAKNLHKTYLKLFQRQLYLLTTITIHMVHLIYNMAMTLNIKFNQ